MAGLQKYENGQAARLAQKILRLAFDTAGGTAP
jgi:hypothetical protein